MKINLLNPFLVIIAIILGRGIYENFDFDAMTFKEPWLTALYAVVFVVALYLLFQGMTKDKDSK